ncbi:MAG TPA: alanine racemase, partial [Candidatus Saccharimonadia bacterium]|nr:alanine racemase [Candidatus Saccharimonadia bacterium]
MIRRHLKTIARHLLSSGYRPLNRIEVSRAALQHNVGLVQAQHRDYTIIPVLKGNAYGHGIDLVARALKASPLLAVDGYHEAEHIHDVTDHRVLVMGYIRPGNVRLLNTTHCSYVVQDIAGLKAFGALGRVVRIHLELNTGMNRLGLSPSELPAYLEVLRSYPKLQLEGVMTHLADGDNATSDEFNRRQQEAFDAQIEMVLAAGFRPRYVHI